MNGKIFLRCGTVTVSVLLIALTAVKSIAASPVEGVNVRCANEKCSESGTGVVDSLVGGLMDFLNAQKCALSTPDMWPKSIRPEAIPYTIFDFVVVGAGSAGSVVASRLSENVNHRVLVAEIGNNPGPESEMFTMSATLHGSEFAFTDYGEPFPDCCQAMKNERCYWPRGKMIGGSGAMNGNVFLLGNPADFETWQRMGNTDWSWSEILRYAERATSRNGNDASTPIGKLVLNAFHYIEGYNELSAIMLNATAELGMQNLNDFISEGTRIGISRDIMATIANGVRMSTGKTYLSIPRDNLDVIKNAEVTKIIIDSSKRARGIEFIIGGRHRFQAWAKKEVILSAGAFGSPKILMLSGIGNRADLRSLRIPLVADLPVGNNLQDNGMMPLLVKIGKPVQVPEPLTSYENLFNYFASKTGPLASDHSLMAFIKANSSYQGSNPDLQMVHNLALNGSADSFRFLGFKESVVELVQNETGGHHILQIMGCLMNPQSRGRVRLKSSNPRDNLRIFNEFASHGDDKATLLGFVRYVQRLMQTETFMRYDMKLVHLTLPNCQQYVYDSDDYWLCYIRHFFISAWHPVGTCRMGPLVTTEAVVDSALRVHGISGLRVVDASVMPKIVSGNTNGVTIMIAEKGAQMIKDFWAQRPKESAYDGNNESNNIP